MKNFVFNQTILTDETIEKTRKWFHDNCLACIEEIESGKCRVNDQDLYFKQQREYAKEYINGTHQITFTFLQRAYYIQTGESVALLS